MVTMPEGGISVTSRQPLFQTAPTKNNCQLTLPVIFSPWFP